MSDNIPPDEQRERLSAEVERLEAMIPKGVDPRIEALKRRMVGDAEWFWVQQRTDPRRLAAELGHVKLLISAGQLAEAAAKLERFEMSRQQIAGMLLKFGLLKFRRAEGRQQGSFKEVSPAMLAEIDDLVSQEDMKPREAVRRVMGPASIMVNAKSREDYILRVWKQRHR